MKFSELLERVRGRGVKVVPTPSLAVGGGGGAADPEIQGVCEDSRKVRPGDLFVARSGSKRSGAEFIQAAVAAGAVAVVMETPLPKDEIEPQRTQSAQKVVDDVSVNSVSSVVGAQGVAWAEVADANLACAVLAHEVAGNPTAGMKMIGITGTKGKTTVAYLLRSVLKAAGRKVGMIGTVEIDDGKDAVPAEMTTPGSVELVELFSRMKAHGVTHCVMEVSSHALHQHRVAGIDWAVAIFTNLTGDHLDYHKTMEEYAAAKAMLFEGLKEGAVAVVNGDDLYAPAIMRNCRANSVPIQVAPLPPLDGEGLHSRKPPKNGWVAIVCGLTSESMHVHVRSDYERAEPVFEFDTPMIGRHNAYNLLATIAAASALGIRVHDALKCLENDTGAPGRLQPVVPPGCERKTLPFQVFVDYAHTHGALENVLDTLRTTITNSDYWKKHLDKLETRGRLICLFGCGGDRDRTKRPKMGAVAERLADVVIVTSDNPRTEAPGAIIEEICAGFTPGWKSEGKISIEPDRRAAIRMAIGMAQAGEVVLLAGKGHENYQIIGTTKHHFDDVEEAEAALRDKLATNKHE